MSGKKLLNISYIVLIICLIPLAVYIVKKTTGNVDFEMLNPIILGIFSGALGSYIMTKRKEKRNRNIPSFDERTVKLSQKYFLIAFYFILIGVGAALIIAYLMGIESIETGLLIVLLMMIYIVLGLGFLVVKRM